MPGPSNQSPYEPDAHGEPVEGLVVRAATAEDSEAIARIDEERGVGSIGVPTPRIQRVLERSAQDLTYTCVAVVSERIVGYAKCAYRVWVQRGEIAKPPDGWYLMGVEVFRAHRRRGIGRAMTSHRLRWLSSRTDVVYYFTGEGNRVSLDLHRAFGFEELARGVAIPAPAPFSDEEPHVVCRLALSPSSP